MLLHIDIRKYKILLISVLVLSFFCLKNVYAQSTASEGIQYFPASYQSYLNALKASHPNWRFVAVNTNLDWHTVQYNEDQGSKNLVPNSYTSNWKESDNEIEPGWVTASDSSIAYMMDPRNFLTDDKIFQFATTKNNSSTDTVSAVSAVLSGTPMGEGSLTSKYQRNTTGNWQDLKDASGNTVNYSQLILSSAANCGLSGVHLASRIRQETGGDIINNKSIYGIYPGLEGFYNYLNVGANGSNPVYNGLIYAKNHGWTDPQTAISAGANNIYSNYTKWGQNTVYFEKWDVNDETGGQTLYTYQYMTNIMAASSESSRMYTAYTKAGMLNSAFEFRIPVFSNMPSSATSLVDSILSLDSPQNNTVVSSDVNLPVYGWFLTEDSQSKIKIYVDDNLITDNISRYQRTDVINSISGYGGAATNPQAGFYATVNTTNLTKGAHVVKVQILDRDDNVLRTETRNITINRPDTYLQVDSPKTDVTYKSSLDINGWCLSEDANAKLNVYLDGKKLDNVARTARSDVFNVVSGYGGTATNPKPGYTVSLDTSNISDGKHDVKIEVVSSDNKVVAEKELSVNVKQYESLLDVDSPQDNAQVYGSTVNIFGWCLSEDLNAKLNIYLDGKLLNNTITRSGRPDLKTAITNYSLYGGDATNPNAGYSLNIDTYNLSYGSHSIKIDYVSSSNKLLQSYTKNFVMKKYESILNVDSPQTNGNVNDSGIEIYGWYLTGDANSKLKIYVDNNQVTDTISRYKRSDLSGAIGNYSLYGGDTTNPNSGFYIKLNTNNISFGQHKIRVDVTAQNDRVLESKEIPVNLKPVNYILNIDSPQTNGTYKTSVNVYGWYLSEDKSSTLNMYFDDQKVNNVSRYQRLDVINAVNGYGNADTNPNNAYYATIDTSKVSDGAHTVKIEVISSSGKVLTSQTRQINIKKYDSMLNVDSPQIGGTYKTSVNVYGWYLSEDKGSKVNIYLDGTAVSNISRYQRTDVFNAVKGYGGAATNPNNAYYATIDTSKINDGTHSVKIDVVSSNNEIISTQTKQINVKKYDSMLNLDSPQINGTYKTSVNVYGWYLSEDKNSKLNIYIDGTVVNNISRYQRTDVFNAVKGYGGAATNPNNAYYATIDTSKINDGTHNIRVDVVSSNNEIISTQTRQINIKKYDSMLNLDSP